MADEKEGLLESQDESTKEHPIKGWNSKNCLGITFIVVDCMSSIGSISCLQLTTDLPPNFELNSLRFAIGLVFVTVYLLLTRELPRIRKELTAWVFLGVLVTYFYNLSLYNEYVKELPIGAIYGIGQGLFILLVAIGSRILLKQNHSWLKLALTFTSFIGIGLVILSSFLPSRDIANKCEWSDTNLTSTSKDFNKLNISSGQYVKGHGPSLENRYYGTNVTFLPEDCRDLARQYTTKALLIAIGLIFASILCVSIENLVISGTSLKEVNGIFLSFWYFLFGSISSALTSVMFENIFIPDKLTDKIYSVVHCTLASAKTILYIYVLKLLESNLTAVVYSIDIPLSLGTHMFLLQSVTPPVELWLLILGLLIITISVLAISLNECLYSKN